MGSDFKPFSLSEVFSVRPRFGRSVNIERDFYSQRSLEGYVVTSTSRHALERMIFSARSENTNRAWTLTGPYGSGKSTFGLFAAKLFDCRGQNDRTFAQELLKRADSALWRQLYKSGPDQLELFSVLVSGSREPIASAILRGLLLAVRKSNIPNLARLESKIREADPHGVSGLQIIEILDEVLGTIQSQFPGAGVLLVIDELGKLLEYAATDSQRTDIFVLQQLAEAANDSNRKLFLLTSLHQAFDQYAWRLSKNEREEWTKVQGRFEDIAFQEPNEQILQILQEAFDVKASSHRAVLNSTGQHLAETAWSLDICGLLPKEEAVRLLSRTMPLHPLVSLTLGPIFRRFGQNERSLFAFLTSDEPFGLKHFINTFQWTEASRRLVSLDNVYDYLVSALGSSLFVGPDARRWTEIDSAINRLGRDASEMELRLIKTIGLLRAIGDQGNIRSSREILHFSLSGSDIKEPEIEQALSSLVDQSIVIERRFNNTFALWEGSDINIEDRLSEAEKQVDWSIPMAQILRQSFVVRPVVAKRHSHESGTLRYFDVLYADITDLEQVALGYPDHGDGKIVFVLPKNKGERETLEAQLTSETWTSEKQTVFALLDNVEELSYWVRREECCRWVRANTPELEGDRPARLELAAQHAAAKQAISKWVDEILNVAIARTNRWYWRGNQLHAETPRHLQDELSRVFDEVFSECPSIHNELVNRNAISAAAATARKQLLESMILNGHQDRLGIMGAPPQLSIYLSVLSATTLHRAENGKFGYFPPKTDADRRLSRLWAAIGSFLDGTEGSHKTVDAFFDLLKSPPFGLKRGLHPVILAAVLLHFDSELALYEQGNFVAKLSLPVFERLMRAPANFSLQFCRIDGARRDALQTLIQTFSKKEGGFDPERDQYNVLTIVRPLMRFAVGLDHYTKVTGNVSELAQRIRQSLLTTREPDKLLFKYLPEACGFSELTTFESASEEVESFVDSLRQGIAELKRAYPELLVRIEAMIAESFQLKSLGESMRQEFRKRAALLERHVADKRLKSLVIRVQNSDSEFDQWLESLAALLTGKPPNTWIDGDLNRLQVALTDFSRSFINLERIVFAIDERKDISRTHEIVRLTLTKLGAAELERLIWFSDDDKVEIDRISALFEQLISDEKIHAKRELKLAILTGLLLKNLEDQNEFPLEKEATSIS